MREVFGLTDPMPMMSPVHIPRGFTKAYINGDRPSEDLGARVRAAHGPARRTPRDRADRGHRPRRGRGGHRPVERGRRGDARGARGHRQRGRSRPADQRDRAQRQASSRPTVSRSPGRSSTRCDPRRPARPGRRARARPGAVRDPLSGGCLTGRSCPTSTLAMVLEGVRGETAPIRGRTSTGSSNGVADRRDGAGPHARTDRTGHARHRPRRPRGRPILAAHGGALGRGPGRSPLACVP